MGNDTEQWCFAQRSKISMIAGGNHTTIFAQWRNEYKQPVHALAGSPAATGLLKPVHDHDTGTIPSKSNGVTNISSLCTHWLAARLPYVKSQI